MSAILDKSLDEIVSETKKTTQNNRRRARRSAGNAAPKAPSGGIQKNSRPAKQQPQQRGQTKQQQQNQQKAAAAKNVDSKVIVSNLPKDVSEQQIKEYFTQSVGPVKKVIIAYGPNSQSRGIAEVVFQRADGATKASTLNGLLVDGRPIKIEIVVSSSLARIIPAPKSLADRTTVPKNMKNQPKAASDNKKQEKKGREAKGTAKPAANGNKAAGNARNKRGTRISRPKKTEAELDLEMADYYSAAPAAAAAPAAEAAVAPVAAAPAANDTSMDDNIM